MKFRDRFNKKDKKTDHIKRSFISRFDIINRFKHWYLGGISFFRSFFRVHAAKQTIYIILFVLLVAFIMAAFYTNAGEFVVKVDRKLAKEAFT